MRQSEIRQGDGLRVALARVSAGADRYAPADIRQALNNLGNALGWAKDGKGPFGAAIASGARVVVKPNWVMHRNKGPWGVECLVTHPTVVKQVVEAALQSGADRVTVGDAPIQGCNWEALMAFGDLGRWAGELATAQPRFAGAVDFRRTRSRQLDGVLVQAEDQVPLSSYVLFDLGRESLLEPVSGEAQAFRVTQYDPDKMRHTHQPGRHQYLVAREIIAADVVVSVPKLKTHRKAGITNALKNLVGINGNKEFLPHHRVGGSQEGGDCYPGRSVVKRSHELILDAQNRSRAHLWRRILNVPARMLSLAGTMFVDQIGIDGSWSGNDTVWRMCLDLNRILLYGRLDGSLADEPQRRVLTVADAIVAGQGDGPLAPEPFGLGVLFGGDNAAAMDHVGARLLGMDPQRIPIAREAFGRFRWPLAQESAAAVDPRWVDGAPVSFAEIPEPESYPLGWLDAVAGDRRGEAPTGRSYRPPLRERLTPQEA
ncbi:MAG TPA: DUF362 domain-containing protein [Gemmatimonadales bacterium]|nr:DUF362 domain-containing protein [Gemmatimonadales bacterium]